MYEFTGKPYCQNSQMGICPLYCCDCTPLDWVLVLIAAIGIGIYVAFRVWKNRHGGQW